MRAVAFAFQDMSQLSGMAHILFFVMERRFASSLQRLSLRIPYLMINFLVVADGE